MAMNLLRAGFELTVHSRSAGPVEELRRAGATAADGPASVAAASEVVIVMVPDTSDLIAVIEGAGGLAERLRPDTIVVAMGTHDPAAMPEVAEVVVRHSGWFLDAPVSGGESSAERADLAIMVGGPTDAYERIVPVLEAMGSTVVRVGDVGAGQVAKACNQLVVGSTIQAVAEALVLAARSGVDPRLVREVMLGGFARSRVLEEHGERMLEGRFDPGGRVELHAKDARIVLAIAAQRGVELPGFGPVAAQFEALIASGGGALDHSALVTLLLPEAAVGGVHRQPA